MGVGALQGVLQPLDVMVVEFTCTGQQWTVPVSCQMAGFSVERVSPLASLILTSARSSNLLGETLRVPTMSQNGFRGLSCGPRVWTPLIPTMIDEASFARLYPPGLVGFSAPR